MPTPMPHQITGALFLAGRKTALLADEQRVGKTGAFIRACDYVLARKILVITTATGRAQWGSEMREWGLPRSIQVIYKTSTKIRDNADVVVIGWPSTINPKIQEQLLAREWDVIGLDESHYAKNPTAKRTKAVYDELPYKAEYVWPLSGTPMPNSPLDMLPMFKALCPEKLKAQGGWPDVTAEDKFVRQYCTWYMKGTAWNRIRIITGGENLEEFKERFGDFWLRRTQQDVGITRPLYSVLSLNADRLGEAKHVMAQLGEEAEDILAAAEYGDTKTLEMHMGPLRRITGALKAYAVAEAVKEEFENGLDKIVLMCWHSDVIDILKHELHQFGVVGIDGRTPPTKRADQVEAFQSGSARVFVGQMVAAGEAIDLSAAAVLWFVEYSFVPKDMSQAALRITNHSQTRQALVRVCALSGSIDESFARVLTRKVATIRSVMEN